MRQIFLFLAFSLLTRRGKPVQASMLSEGDSGAFKQTQALQDSIRIRQAITRQNIHVLRPLAMLLDALLPAVAFAISSFENHFMFSRPSCNRRVSHRSATSRLERFLRRLPLVSMGTSSGKAFPRKSLRIAVVGGGSAGIAAARFLKRAGHNPQLFEAASSFGGIWAGNPVNEVVYKNLKTNLPTVVMQSPDLDFPAELPSYVTKAQLGAYIEEYAREFGINALAIFNATVTKVELQHEAAGDEHSWKVQWTSNESHQSDTFDAVVVATGHYDKPYKPSIPGEAEWLLANPSHAIVHSREYYDPKEFDGQSILVVGGKSSGVDISRELRGVAKWVYVLDKKCSDAKMHEDQGVTYVPLGTRLCSDGHLRLEHDGKDIDMPGPPVERVVLATGYEYDFPFLDENALGMRCRGKRYVTPLYQHLLHANVPTLGFIGMPLAIPCPIPFFEIQAAYLAEFWADPSSSLNAFPSEEERQQWVQQRLSAVAGRLQDMHWTKADGGSGWGYMRDLLAQIHATRPPTPEGDSWLERSNWDMRLKIVQEVSRDRRSRYPKKPWHEDAYRQCTYTVDWDSGKWTVDVPAEAESVLH